MRYNNDELSLVYLNYLGVSQKKIFELLKTKKSPYLLLSKLDSFTKSILGEPRVEVIEKTSLNETLKNIDNYLEKEEIGVVTLISKNFPEGLKYVDPTVMVLYYKGDLSIACDSSKIIGVVGTRKPTNYGRNVTEKFVKEIVTKGKLITVSGLAYGIDSEVARVSLENGGKTIAVLGGGIKNIYPSSNIALANKIVERGGLILSEYYPNFRPTQYTFPERNRIISGLSDGLLVIEAGLKSGSLITANLAIEQGKELFVVPGEITNSNYAGSNKLIEDLPHTFTSSTANIFKSYKIKEQDETESHQYTLDEQEVINALKTGLKTTDELCEIIQKDYKTINLLLTEMEIGGIIKKLPGDYYSCNF